MHKILFSYFDEVPGHWLVIINRISRRLLLGFLKGLTSSCKACEAVECALLLPCEDGYWY